MAWAGGGGGRQGGTLPYGGHCRVWGPAAKPPGGASCSHQRFQRSNVFQSEVWGPLSLSVGCFKKDGFGRDCLQARNASPWKGQDLSTSLSTPVPGPMGAAQQQ